MWQTLDCRLVEILFNPYMPRIHKGDVCKQCRSSSDATECSISSGSTLFALMQELCPPPQPKGRDAGGEYIAFGADPVSVAHCLHSISLTSGWILTKLAQTHYWEGRRKEVFRYWWPWPHFQGQPTFWNFQILTKIRSLGPNDEFWPDFIYCNVGMI